MARRSNAGFLEASMVKKRRSLRQKRAICKKKQSVGSYFVRQTDVDFIGSGCAVLDCVLGGGYPLGRMVNIVGDKSTGKTLLAIEACANFHHKYSDAPIYYLEAEAAFDKSFAGALGMPIDAVTFIDDVATVEGFQKQLEAATQAAKDQPAIFIVDSLDALSDDAEMERDIEKGSYGASKAKKMSELFRRMAKKLESSQLLLIIISQIRDKMNVTFGRKTTRSGGRAMDFYASQVLYLAELSKQYRTIRGVKRPVAVQVRAKVDKNKVGLPFRECDFEIHFGYGVDSLASNLNYLVDVGRAKAIDSTLTKKGAITAFLKKCDKMDDKEYRALDRKVSKLVHATWQSIEEEFVPKRRKY